MDAPFRSKTLSSISTIDLDFTELWNATLTTNASLLRADQNSTLAQLDYKKVLSRNYPYVKLNAGYGYTFNKYDINATRIRNNWGFNGGITVGFNISTVTAKEKNAMPVWLSATPSWSVMNWNRDCVLTSATFGKPTGTISAC